MQTAIPTFLLRTCLLHLVSFADGNMEDMITYEGEEMYEKRKDEQLFAMDRFDPDSEVAAEKGKTVFPVKVKGSKVPQDEKPKDGEVKKRRRKKSKKGSKHGDEAEGFTVLGDPTDSQKKKVARVLPQWLAQPDIMQVHLLPMIISKIENVVDPISDEKLVRWTYRLSSLQ